MYTVSDDPRVPRSTWYASELARRDSVTYEPAVQALATPQWFLVGPLVLLGLTNVSSSA